MFIRGFTQETYSKFPKRESNLNTDTIQGSFHSVSQNLRNQSEVKCFNKVGRHSCTQSFKAVIYVMLFYNGHQNTRQNLFASYA
jgi:hypothetical protein